MTTEPSVKSGHWASELLGVEFDDKAKDITFTIDTAGKVSSDALENGVVVMKDTPTPSKSKNKTGDEANGALWALLLLMAGGALGGTVWFKRKKRA